MFNDQDIFKRYQQGDKSVVGDVFKQYEPMIKGVTTQYKQSGISPEALDLEAKRIVVNSLKSFNPGKGNLTSHLQNNLKAMYRATNKASPVYIPDARASMFRKYKDMHTDITEVTGREPSISEMADKLKISLSQAKRLSKETGVKLLPDIHIYESDASSPVKEDPDAFIRSIKSRIKDPVDLAIADMSFTGDRPASNIAIGKKLGISEGAVRQRKDKIIKLIRELE